MTDAIADMFARISNGYRARKKEISLPHSTFKRAVGKALERHGFVKSVKDKEGKLVIVLKYDGKTPALSALVRVSKPGLRVFLSKSKLRPVLGGLGVSIISTPLGVLSDSEAREKGVGGEVVGRVW